MPYVKSKPFSEPNNVPCYKCNAMVLVGSHNWLHNTQHAKMFRHKWCDKNHMMTLDEKLALDGIVPAPIVTIPNEPLVITSPTIATVTGNPLDNWRNERIIHKQTQDIIDLLKLGRYPFLFGAPGAGKTFLAMQIAKAAGFRIQVITCNQEMSRTELFGAVSPLTGNYHGPIFKDNWTYGRAIIVFDEVGLCYGAFTNSLNSVLEQKSILFPDATAANPNPTPKAKDCYIWFNDNSNLHGNDRKWPERENQGNAFRDRLAYVPFEYDTDIERQIVGTRIRASLIRPWHLFVRACRKICEGKTIPVAASPRFAYNGAEELEYRLVQYGAVNQDTIFKLLTTYLWQGLSPDIIGKPADRLTAFGEIAALPELQAVIQTANDSLRSSEVSFNA